MSTAFPADLLPSAQATAHSSRLTRLIHAEIERAGGWLDFSRFMELCLFTPGRGYYCGGAAKFGCSGDFVTAPEISPLFAGALAHQAAQVLRATGGSILELGAGSGALAGDLLLNLDAIGALPERYLILEISAELRDRQCDRIGRLPPALSERVSWLDTLPKSHSGLVLANELLDALPVHLISWREDGIAERGVIIDGESFAFQDRPLRDETLLRAAQPLRVQAPYVSEISKAAPALLRTLADVLRLGVVLFVDYGFGSPEYYHPQRASGTLMCHYRHRAHADPFFAPGLQDITAHIDFSAVAAAGVGAGLDLLGYTTQAQLLINLGITDLLGQTSADQAAQYLPRAAEAHKLLSPAEMGELFKAIALGRDFREPLIGFRAGDKSRLL